MSTLHETTSKPATGRAFRADTRVAGPFEGRWVGLLSVPIRVHDLSVSGCLVEAHHEPPAGRRLTLDLELPFEGWLRLQGEIVYSRADYGFAVRFVDLPEDVRARLAHVVQRLQSAPHGA